LPSRRGSNLTGSRGRTLFIACFGLALARLGRCGFARRLLGEPTADLRVLQSRFGSTNAKLWRALLQFAPEWLILETSDKIRYRQYRASRRIAR
jgi:hypothetical protein